MGFKCHVKRLEEEIKALKLAEKEENFIIDFYIVAGDGKNFPEPKLLLTTKFTD